MSETARKAGQRFPVLASREESKGFHDLECQFEIQEIKDLRQQLAAEREKREALAEALRQIATVEANDLDEAGVGLKQTQSYEIATAALGK